MHGAIGSAALVDEVSATARDYFHGHAVLCHPIHYLVSPERELQADIRLIGHFPALGSCCKPSSSEPMAVGAHMLQYIPEIFTLFMLRSFATL